MMNTTPKPFPCKVAGCTASFNTEDHLATHSRRHELTQLELPAKNALFSDKTPTPTRTVDRLLKNCDAVGLFDDLQHVNPFDETFRKAVESNCPLSLAESPMKLLAEVTGTGGGGDLNTPNIFPSVSKQPEPVKPQAQTESNQQQPQPPITIEVKKPRLMLKTLSAGTVRKTPKILPKPAPGMTQYPTTKDRLKAFLLKESIEAKILLMQVPPTKPPPSTAKRKEAPKQTSSKPGTVTVEERNREAARRYRQRLKVLQGSLADDNEKLKAENKQLKMENVNLKKLVAKLQTELANARHAVALTGTASSTVTTDVNNDALKTPQICILLPSNTFSSTGVSSTSTMPSTSSTLQTLNTLTASSHLISSNLNPVISEVKNENVEK